MNSLRKFQRRKRRKIFSVLLLVAALAAINRERKFWMKERSVIWWSDVVKVTLTEEERIENFRMSQTTSNFICTSLQNQLERSSKVRPCLEIDCRVGIAIYYMASNADYRTVGNLFGVAKSTVCLVINAIMNNLFDRYVSFPKDDNLQKVIDGFAENWNFPNCAGAIDGTHVPIIGPAEHHADYVNRKGWYSIILQGVSDHWYVFTDINVGWPGRVHDARVFANSEIFQQAEKGNLFPKWSIPIRPQRTQMPIVLLGDAAYPLKPWLIKPYSVHGLLTREHQYFNYCLSRARMVIENSFGRLKGHWRCWNDLTTDFVPTLAASCVVLHNICELRAEAFDDRWLLPVQNNELGEPAEEDMNDLPNASAALIRDSLVQYFQV